MTATQDHPTRKLESRARTVVTAVRSSWLTRAGLVLMAATTFANIVNFVFHIIQLRILGPSRYGELSALLNVVVVLTLPLSAVEAAVVQMVATHVAGDERVSLRSTLRWWIPVSVGSTVFVAAVSPVIGKELRISSTATVMLLALWIAPAMLSSVLQGALIGERRIKPVALVQFANAGMRLLVGVLLAELGFGVAGAFAGTAAGAILMCALLWLTVGPQIRSRADGPRVNTRDVLRSASSIGGITVMISLDTWMARHFLGGVDAGVYAAAATLGKIPMFLAGAVYLVMFPRIATEHGRGPTARRHLIHGLIFVGVVSLLGASVLIGLPGPFLSVFANHRYAGASHPLMLLAVADICAAFSSTFVYFLMARRSRLALVGWAGSLLAAVLVLASHETTIKIAVDMLIANVLTLVFLLVTAMALLAKDVRDDDTTSVTAEVRRWLPSDRPRRTAVLAGIVAVVTVLPLGLTNDSLVTGVFADLAAAALLVAVVAGAIRVWQGIRVRRLASASSLAPQSTAPAEVRDPGGGSATSKWWALLVAAVSLAAVSTWFEPGTVIAAVDNLPPNGTVWISHIFDAWGWSGVGLGGPNTNQILLPWAVTLLTVEHLGGSAGMAQQIWTSCLVVGAAVAAFGMLRLLRMTAPAACVGALLYVFSAYTLAMVGYSPVFLAAQTMFPVLGCIIVAVATARMRITVGVILLACTAPLDGYVYTNPPAIFLLAIAAVVTIALVAALEGRLALIRTGKLLLAGAPVLLLVSAYWLVPSLIASHSAATSQWAPVSAWTWTEVRATLANALWLNTSWGWKYVSIAPMGRGYGHLPLLLLKYLPTMAAFSAIPLTFIHRVRRSFARSGTVVVAAAVALFFLLLSNGTRAPGSIIFEPLYHLPYGWLLREPARFLLAADFAYAVLIALAFQEVWELVGGRLSVRRQDQRHRVDGSPALQLVGRPGWRPWAPRAGMLIAVVALLVPAYPLIFGEVVPSGSKNGEVADQHVRFPAYWEAMASYLNHTAKSGAVLTLPPNVGYQVPYTWGYDGAEGFLADLIRPPLIDPVSQNYYATSQELLFSVDRIAYDVLAHRWTTVNRMVSAIGAKYVLLRKDVKSKGAVPPIISPQRLGRALQHDPSWHLVHQDGPLELFRVDQPKVRSTQIITDASGTPNLEALATLPAGTAVIQSKPRTDLPALIETPPFSRWTLTDSAVTLKIKLPKGRTFAPLLLPSWGAGAHRASTAILPSVTESVDGNVSRLSMSLGATLIRDGDFSSGGWQGSAQDCWVSERGRITRGRILSGAAPGGGNALSLTSKNGIACEYAPVKLTHGPVLISLTVRHVSGAPAQICLWYAPRKLCSAPPLAISDKPGWRHYQFTIGAPVKAKELRLEIYSSQASHGRVSVNDFAAVAVHPLDLTKSLVLISPAPDSSATAKVHLIQAAYAADSQWQGPVHTKPVVVDGMRNGWLGLGSASEIHYQPTSKIKRSYLVSLIGGVIVLILVLVAVNGTVRRRWSGEREQLRTAAISTEHDSPRNED